MLFGRFVKYAIIAAGNIVVAENVCMIAPLDLHLS